MACPVAFVIFQALLGGVPWFGSLCVFHVGRPIDQFGLLGVVLWTIQVCRKCSHCLGSIKIFKLLSNVRSDNLLPKSMISSGLITIKG